MPRILPSEPTENHLASSSYPSGVAKSRYEYPFVWHLVLAHDSIAACLPGPAEESELVAVAVRAAAASIIEIDPPNTRQG
jgi:hypothetical protein